MSVVRVFIVDDQDLYRAGIKSLFAKRAEIEVVGEAANGREAVDQIPGAEPDVVLMDLRMPDMDGVEATSTLRDAGASCRVVALTTFDDDELVFAALRAGAIGYLLKDTPVDQLIQAIEAAAAGESFLQPRVASKVVAAIARLPDKTATTLGAPMGLSARELEVLQLLSDGRTNKEIAAALFIAEGTVKNHLTRIFEKLDVSDRTQAALRALELGIAGS